MSTNTYTEPPVFWLVTGRDFGRSHAWARTWVNPIRLAVRAELARRGLDTRELGVAAPLTDVTFAPHVLTDVQAFVLGKQSEGGERPAQPSGQDVGDGARLGVAVPPVGSASCPSISRPSGPQPSKFLDPA